MNLIFLPLLAGHLIADFWLQPYSWVVHEKENGIKINLLASAVLDEQCLIDEYPDNTAFAVTMGIDAAVIPMTDAEIRQHDRESIAAWNKENCEEVESYVSPFDGRQK